MYTLFISAWVCIFIVFSCLSTQSPMWGLQETLMNEFQIVFLTWNSHEQFFSFLESDKNYFSYVFRESHHIWLGNRIKIEQMCLTYNFFKINVYFRFFLDYLRGPCWH